MIVRSTQVNNHVLVATVVPSFTHITELLKLLRGFLTSISNTWVNGSSEHKRKLQKLVVPNGLRIENDYSFQMVDLPPLLRLTSNRSPSNSNVVDRMRITWNTLVPEMEAVAGAMEEKLLVAEDAVVRSMTPIAVVIP